MSQSAEFSLDRRMTLMLAGGMAFAAMPAAAAEPNPALEGELKATLGELTRRIHARDFTALDLFDGDDALLIGSATGEVCLGREQIHAHLAHYYDMASRVGFTWSRTLTGALGDTTAWLWAEGEVALTGSDNKQTTGPYRLASVFVRRGSDWRIRLFSGSQPA